MLFVLAGKFDSFPLHFLNRPRTASDAGHRRRFTWFLCLGAWIVMFIFITFLRNNPFHLPHPSFHGHFLFHDIFQVAVVAKLVYCVGIRVLFCIDIVGIVFFRWRWRILIRIETFLFIRFPWNYSFHFPHFPLDRHFFFFWQFFLLVIMFFFEFGILLFLVVEYGWRSHYSGDFAALFLFVESQHGGRSGIRRFNSDLLHCSSFRRT
mmetsp:Transcript_25398/g.41724  ORF Transcript_25398/g.41724 Transcript_25398/m.41724 type:complete len:207 (+) Transcript_25398:531-1151(+)